MLTNMYTSLLPFAAAPAAIVYFALYSIVICLHLTIPETFLQHQPGRFSRIVAHTPRRWLIGICFTQPKHGTVFLRYGPIDPLP